MNEERRSDKHQDGRHLHAVIAGYASLDRIYQVESLPAPGTTGIITRTSDDLCWGGCAFNIGVGLARLGLDAGVIGTVGEDAGGAAYIEWLRSNGIDTTAVAISPGVGTPISNLYYDRAGTSVCYFWPGAPGYIGEPGPQRDILARADLLVLSVARHEMTTRLLDVAESLDKPVAWSVKADAQAYPPELVERLLAASRIVFLNQVEMEFVGEATGRDTSEKILAAGPELVVLTLGAEGSLVTTRREQVEVPAAKVRAVVDATGSGDAYVAGFLASYIRGSSPREAAQVGATEAAAVLEQVGSQTGLCTWEEQLWRQKQA